MKPIAQSFLIAQPDTSLDGVFLTRINVYFKKVSGLYGIIMEIRTVENGFPTPNVIPGGRSSLACTDVFQSDDATIPTAFRFNSLPFLESNKQYAFVLVPDGGNDEYLVWTSKIGDTDASSNSPIFTNNQLGNLFISSNDLVWTPVTLESMKYDLYVSRFLSQTANVFLRPMPTEFVRVEDTVGKFLVNETVWTSNSQIAGYAQTTVSTTLVTVPNSTISDLAVNNWIYIATSDRSSLNLRQVMSAPNSTTITISSNATFTNTTCIFGRIAGDSQLYAAVKNVTKYFPDEDAEITLVGPTSNSTLNLSGAAGKYMFGISSQSSAKIVAVANKQYDTITPQINYIRPSRTTVTFSYHGYSNAGIADTGYTYALPNVPNEFIDNERVVYSKSNEVSGPLGSNASLLIKARLTTANNLTAPYIDRLGTMVTLTYNFPTAQTQLLGYHLNLKDVSGTFEAGDIVTQGSNTGVIDFANGVYIRLNSPNGAFTNTSITASPSGATANVTTATYFDETLENGYYGASRYISKNVILADKQDAEDLVSYLTIHRPVGTQFNVYGKFLNGTDPEPFSDKSWSYMPEMDATIALFSSASNREDVIEAQFGLPQSLMIDVDDAVANTSLANVTVADTTFYNANSYIYLRDNVTGAFNVRKVDSIPNRTTLTLHSKPSFSSTNTVVGTIDGLQSETGAFLYANNNGIIRYVTSSDVVYDSYKTFAIKIVPVSNNSILVPTMKNMRCIALQI